MAVPRQWDPTEITVAMVGMEVMAGRAAPVGMAPVSMKAMITQHRSTLKYNTITLNEVGPVTGTGGSPGSGGTGGWGQLVSGVDGSPGAAGTAPGVAREVEFANLSKLRWPCQGGLYPV